MNEEEKKKLCALVDDYAKAYAKNEYNLGFWKGYIVGVCASTFAFLVITLIDIFVFK